MFKFALSNIRAFVIVTALGGTLSDIAYGLASDQTKIPPHIVSDCNDLHLYNACFEAQKISEKNKNLKEASEYQQKKCSYATRRSIVDRLMDCPGMKDVGTVWCEAGFRSLIKWDLLLVGSQPVCSLLQEMNVSELTTDDLAPSHQLCIKGDLMGCWKAQHLSKNLLSEDQVMTYRNRKCALVNENSPLMAVVDCPGMVAKATTLCKSPKNEFKNFLACQALALLEKEAKEKELRRNADIEKERREKLAKEEAERKRKEQENDPRILLSLAMVALNDKDFEKAIQHGERALAMELNLETLEVLFTAYLKNGFKHKAEAIKKEIAKLTPLPALFSKQICSDYQYDPKLRYQVDAQKKNESRIAKNKWIIPKSEHVDTPLSRYYIGNADGTIEIMRIPSGDYSFRYIKEISCNKGIMVNAEGFGDCNGYYEMYAMSLWDGTSIPVKNPVFSSDMSFLIGMESVSTESKLTLYDCRKFDVEKKCNLFWTDKAWAGSNSECPNYEGCDQICGGVFFKSNLEFVRHRSVTKKELCKIDPSALTVKCGPMKKKKK